MIPALRPLLALAVLAGCPTSEATVPDDEPHDEGPQCDTPETDTDVPADTDLPADTDVPPPDCDPLPLDQEELDGLETWASHSVTMTIDARTTAVGDRLALLVERTSARLEITSGTRAQDHNSSRSNKTASVAISDPLDDGSGGGLVVRWDGRDACVTLPCASDDRAVGASSLLTLDLGTALDDGAFALSWAETYPVTATFDGALSVDMVDHRGHVTVLKASATPTGDVVITSATGGEELSVTDGGAPAFDGVPLAGPTPLATIAGTTGSSWPTGLVVETTPRGTWVGFTW